MSGSDGAPTGGGSAAVQDSHRDRVYWLRFQIKQNVLLVYHCTKLNVMYMVYMTNDIVLKLVSTATNIYSSTNKVKIYCCDTKLDYDTLHPP